MPKVKGLRLRELRERKLLTQRDLAALSGVGLSTIVRAEKQRGHATPQVIKKLAKALDVDPGELVEWGEEQRETA